MMFAAALSGMRIGTEAENSHIATATEDSSAPDASREPAGNWKPDVRFEDKEDCPIFFVKDVSDFGVLRVGPHCAEDGFPHAL